MDETTRAPEPMSHVDAAWLRMDLPTNPMVITAALCFARPLSLAAVERLLRERLLEQPRFRTRVEAARVPFLNPRWVDDGSFDMRAHLRRVRVPAPSNQQAFEALLCELVSTPLPRDRPLWQAYFVDDVDGGSALVVKLHHCIADGVALVRLLLSLGDGGLGQKPAVVGLTRPPPVADAVDFVRRAALEATTLGKLVLLRKDPPTALRGPLGPRKHVAFSEALDLATAKRMARALSGKLNDVVQACVVGSLRRYLLAQQPTPPARDVRTLVPVFLRDGARGLGNHFGLVFLSLPLTVSDPVERAREVKRRMDHLKVAHDATVAFALLDGMGIASARLEHVALELFTRKASLLTTNVPGPPSPVTLAGERLQSLLVWAPMAGYLGLGFTIVSYAGALRVGVSADARLLPNPRWLTRGFEASFAELRSALLDGAPREQDTSA